MGTASRKTWLEKQADEVQLRVLAMNEEGKFTLEQMCARLKEDGVEVAPSTLAHSLKCYSERLAPELKLAELWGKQLDSLFTQHPQLDARTLAKGFLAMKMGTADFRNSEMEPGELVFFAQKERELQLKERHLQAMERQNELKANEQNLLQQKVAAAAGGMDGRELYLQAAKDILKKLQTYKELKPALETRREEIVGELAHAAEAFVKKLEAQA